MKKMIMSAVVFSLISSSAFAANLYKKTFKSIDDSSSAQTRVVETFKAAMADAKENKVKVAIEQLKSDYADTGTVDEVREADMFLMEGGRGGLGLYGSTFLVGVPVSMRGSGMIETHDLYFIVRYTVNMSNDTETVVIEKFAEIK